MAQNPYSNDVSEKRDEVATNLRELIDSADELLRSTASYSGAEIEAARGRLKNQLELARVEAGNYRHSLKESYRAVSDATDQCVHEHAWKAVCVAGVIGLLLGKCLSSDHSRS